MIHDKLKSHTEQKKTDTVQKQMKADRNRDRDRCGPGRLTCSSTETSNCGLWCPIQIVATGSRITMSTTTANQAHTFPTVGHSMYASGPAVEIHSQDTVHIGGRLVCGRKEEER